MKRTEEMQKYQRVIKQGKDLVKRIDSLKDQPVKEAKGCSNHSEAREDGKRRARNQRSAKRESACSRTPSKQAKFRKRRTIRRRSSRSVDGDIFGRKNCGKEGWPDVN